MAPASEQDLEQVHAQTWNEMLPRRMADRQAVCTAESMNKDYGGVNDRQL
jgi:hypothetical protein